MQGNGSGAMRKSLTRLAQKGGATWSHIQIADRPEAIFSTKVGTAEADLVTLEKSATVNRGCVVQTHLFHDRIMRMDTVVLEEGSTLGPHCVALPGGRLGAGATVGPASLVMRGDEVPPSTRWQGNPIAPWNVFRKKRGDAPPPDKAPEETAA